MTFLNYKEQSLMIKGLNPITNFQIYLHKHSKFYFSLLEFSKSVISNFKKTLPRDDKLQTVNITPSNYNYNYE